MPLQAVRQFIDGELYMYYAPLLGFRARGGSVQQEWSHQYRPASRNDAHNVRASSPINDLLGREATRLVGTGYDTKRPVVFVAFVQMQSDG